jgi:hypothetical protein
LIRRFRRAEGLNTITRRVEIGTSTPVFGLRPCHRLPPTVGETIELKASRSTARFGGQRNDVQRRAREGRPCAGRSARLESRDEHRSINGAPRIVCAYAGEDQGDTER